MTTPSNCQLPSYQLLTSDIQTICTRIHQSTKASADDETYVIIGRVFKIHFFSVLLRTFLTNLCRFHNNFSIKNYQGLTFENIVLRNYFSINNWFAESLYLKEIIFEKLLRSCFRRYLTFPTIIFFQIRNM